MRHIIVWVSLLVGFGTATVQAQLADKLVPHSGFMYEYLFASQPNGFVESIGNYYVFNVGAYYTLAHKNDIVSVGVQPNLQIGGLRPTVISGRLRVGYLIQTPVYAMARIGANSTPYNQQRFGLSVGVGGTLNAFSYYFANSTDVLNDRGTFFTPSAIAELTFNSITLRLQGALGRGGINPKTFEVETKELYTAQRNWIDAGSIGFGIVYSLGL